MSSVPEAFEEAVYVARPLLPSLDNVMSRLSAVWDSAILTNFGEQHADLKRRITKLLKVKHVSLCNNGTSALLLALKALDIKGRVVTTPFTFPATLNVLEFLGIEPVFCDIDHETLNINSDILASVCDVNEISAILGVHVYGNPCNVDAFEKIANRNHLNIIYDASHAFGVEIEGRGIGEFGDISTFSFHATKLFHTAEGGALAYQNDDLEQQIYLLKNFGIKNEEEVVLPGINAKMNEIQAAIGIEVTEVLHAEIKKRKELYEEYVRKLSQVEGLSVPFDFGDRVKKNYQYFYILIDKNEFGCSRDDLYNKLKSFNIYSRKYFYPLCSTYSWYRQLESASPTSLPVATRVSNSVLVLPLHGGLSIDDINKICNVIIFIQQKSFALSND